MAAFEIREFEKDGIPVFSVKGYLEGEAGLQIDSIARRCLSQGKKWMILDLTTCDIVNSPGISALFGTSVRIKEDFKGQLVICGLSIMNEKTFKMAGIIPMFVETAPNLENAVLVFRKLNSTEK